MASRDTKPRNNPIAALWASLISGMFDSYRPELHYMRGPGPKWRAKHQTSAPAPSHNGLAKASA
jgi:hypothetical protein